MTETKTTAEILREPFPPEIVGKLPRIICPACRKSSSKVCGEHKKTKCGDCGAWITERHIHLDYVGHAAVTDRLLQADPNWNWEPVAFGDDGLPLIKASGSTEKLWIKLTIDGVTRFGVGTCGAGKDEAEKELIGDAIRNAAMRFGVALDLWAKVPLSNDDSDPPPAEKPASLTERTPLTSEEVEEFEANIEFADSLKIIAEVADELRHRNPPKSDPAIKRIGDAMKAKAGEIKPAAEEIPA